MIGHAHSGVSVGDLEAALAFYEEGLGLTRLSRRRVEHPYITRIVNVPGTTAIDVVILALPDGTPAVELLRYQGCDIAPATAAPCDPGVGHLCLLVDDVHAARDRALAHGGSPRSEAPVRIENGPYEGGYGCYLEDPDHHVVELLQPPSGVAA